MNGGFWQGRRVLVTGHTGFKGSWLSLWLQSLGAEVVGFALPPVTRPSLFELAGVDRGMTSILGDVADLDALTAAVTTHRPEVVIHMAAQALVRASYQDPVATFATNVMGTLHLFEAVRRVGGVRAVVNVTSDKCYDNREWLWGYRENEPLGGRDPYSASKACAELATAAYRDSFFPPKNHASHGVAVATARAGNVIGGGDWAPDRLIPDVLAAFGAGRPVLLRNPDAVRPWQHVLEPLLGYLLLAEKLMEEGAAWADAWNFGPVDEDARPVGWIVETLARGWGEEARWSRDTAPHPHEAGLLRLDCAKARQRLGWHPRWTLGDALAAIIAWHRAHLEGADMRAFTLNQIAQYLGESGTH